MVATVLLSGVGSSLLINAQDVHRVSQRTFRDNSTVFFYLQCLGSKYVSFEKSWHASKGTHQAFQLLKTIQIKGMICVIQVSQIKIAELRLIFGDLQAHVCRSRFPRRPTVP